MFWIILLVLFILIPAFYQVGKTETVKERKEAQEKERMEKEKQLKVEYYINLNKWYVKDGLYVYAGETIASINFVKKVGDMALSELPRLLRADKAGYLKHQVKEGRLDIKIDYPEDHKRTSFDPEDIALIVDEK